MNIHRYSSPAIFFSDCHLPLIPHPDQQDWTPRVLRFLKTVAVQAQTIFIVGDLFDFWFEWRYSTPSGAFQVLSELHQLVRSGKEVVYLGGNHDGHVGKFLEHEVQLQVSREPIDALIDGSRFHIIHGDGVAPADHGYRFLRKLVRWKSTESIYKLVHPDLGIWLAKQLSGYSRHHLSPQNDFGSEPYRNYGKRILDSGSYYVVIGHRHRAEFVPHPNGAYLAIGEWIDKGSYGLFKDGAASLNYFKD